MIWLMMHTWSRTYLQMRSSLIFDNKSIWYARTSSRVLASFLWELYAFLHEYYTTKSRNLQPPQKNFAVPVLDNALVPCYARLVHKSQRGLKDIKWYSRVVSCERLSISIKSKDIFIKVFKTYFLILSV